MINNICCSCFSVSSLSFTEVLLIILLFNVVLIIILELTKFIKQKNKKEEE